MSAERVTAPFGRRAVAVTARERHGAYVVLRCSDAAGPRPAGRPVLHADRAPTRWGGGAGERPFLPRAFSVLRAVPGDDGALELQFLLEDVGPGTQRLCELRPATSCSLVGPLGAGFAGPREGRSPLLVGGGVGIAPLAICRTSSATAPALLGFRDAAHAAGAVLLRAAAVATDDGSVGHHGLVTELLAERA